MESYGSWWEVCATRFPETAYEKLGLRGRLRIPESGSIRYPVGLNPPKESRVKRIYTKHLVQRGKH
ncbi:MAG: hypothetical protein WCW13_00305 [archaeon]|jgi:hypothetical protein